MHFYHFIGSLSGKMLKWFRMVISPVKMNGVSTVSYSKLKLHFFLQNARNYVTSSKPLGTRLDTRSTDISCYSAGHTKHEWTSWACIDVLFPYLEEKYEEFGKDDQSDEDESDEQNDTDEEKTEEREADDGKADEPSGQEEAIDLSKTENKSDHGKAGDKSDQEAESADDGQSEPKKPNTREDL